MSNETSIVSNDSNSHSKETLIDSNNYSNESSINSKECMLSTFDNPFNPFEQFDNWFMFDVEKGYYSCSKLDRMTNITEDMSEQEENEEIERAIDTFVKYDFTNTYTKVTRDTKTPVLSQEEFNKMQNVQ